MRLKLKALYELRAGLFPSRLDNFKMFLSRTAQKTISEAQRQTNLDFMNLLSKIYDSRPGDQKRAETIIKRVKEKKQSAEYRWLFEKAKELKGG